MSQNYVILKKDYHRHNARSIGDLASRLSNLHSAKIPILENFCVTNSATEDFFKTDGLRDFIEDQLHGLSLFRYPQIIAASNKIISHLSKITFPEEVAIEIAKMYNHFGHQKYVQLAISVDGDVIPEQVLFSDSDTPIRVKGDANLIEAIKKEWARLYSPEAIAYRLRREKDVHFSHMAIVVYVLPNVLASGAISTVDDVHNNKQLINIEAVWGMPDLFLLGKQDADFYQVEKNTWRVDQIRIVPQKQILSAKNYRKIQRLRGNKSRNQKLRESEIVGLAKAAHKIQGRLYQPQIIQWIKTNSAIEIIRSDAIQEDIDLHLVAKKQSQKPLLLATGLSAGIATGPVRIINSDKDISKIKRGEIVVLTGLTQSMVSSFSKVSGIVCERAGHLSHPSIIARETHVPVITDIREVKSQFRNGEVITIDGSTGAIYAGSPHSVQIDPIIEKVPKSEHRLSTKVYLLYEQGNKELEAEEQLVDGLFGIPLDRDSQTSQDERLTELCSRMGERPVFITVSKLYPPKKEVLTSIVSTRQVHKNLHLSISDIHTEIDVVEAKRMLAHVGIHRSPNLLFYVHISNPLSALKINQILEVGTDGVVIDVDMLVDSLYSDHEGEHQHKINIQDSQIVSVFESIVKSCKKHQIPSYLHSKKYALGGNLLHRLVKIGVTGVVVPQKHMVGIRHELASAEILQFKHWH